jgi:O-antigen/teichoic acid export membrane protein
MIIGGGSQALSTVAIIIAVFYNSSLVVMGACVAAITLAAGLVQIAAWRRYLAHIRITLSGVTRRMTRTIFNYCAAMSVWSFAMLLISGLDTVIVGHFDFKQTGFYAVAASLTNFVILTAGAVFNPLLPATSELAALGDRAAVASLTLRSTRFCAVLLVLTSLPLLLYGGPILSLWVGADYARNSILFLEILTIANMIRQCMLPYAIIVAGNGLQRDVLFAPLMEGAVNLAVSIGLAYRFGAVGVAIGTLIGAIVGASLLTAQSMHKTRRAIPVSRADFLFLGLARPLVCSVPLFVFFFFFHGNLALHGHLPSIMVTLLTCALLWTIGLTHSDRDIFISAIRSWQLNRLARA